MTLNGTLRLSDSTGRRTAGMFGKLIDDNADVFRRYFGAELFAGSLNVDVPEPIPRTELVNMPTYIGDGQAWRCELTGDKFPSVINCWIFRRKGSRVPPGVIELIACELLRTPYKLQHGDRVVLAIV